MLVIANFKFKKKPQSPLRFFRFAVSNHDCQCIMPTLFLSSAKKHPPQNVQQVPEI